MTDISGPPLARTAAEWRRRHLRGNPNRFIADPELRRLANRMLPTHKFDDILAECRRQLGPERTPSKSALSRFWRQKKAAREARSAR